MGNQSEWGTKNHVEAGISLGGATVAVVIPTFNHARFLADAINSVLAQTRLPEEIIVVDDGSTDDPATVVAQFQEVRLIRQDNRGLAGARNTGLWSCHASHIVFLDADDRLLPTALETGLACIARRPHCAFAYGGYRFISEDGHPYGPDCFWPIEGNAHLALLRRNLIVMHAILYQRNCLLAVNGFDATLRRAEDYDIHLRITQRYPIASHPEIVAEYRKHSQNTTNNYFEQLRAVLHVLDLHEARITTDPLARAALHEGRISRRSWYVSQMLAAASAHWRARHEIGILVIDLIRAARCSPRTTAGAFARRAAKVLSRATVRQPSKLLSRWLRLSNGKDT